MPETRKKKERVRLGDVIEVQTPRGLAYAQYSHHSSQFGSLIRVLPGFYDSRPDSFTGIVHSKERFYVFFPVGAAVSQKLVRIAAREGVPEGIRKFPLMRMAGLPDRSGNVTTWGLYDGERDWSVHSLTPEQQTLSIVESWGYPVLVQRITEDWSPVGAYSGEINTTVKNDYEPDDKEGVKGNVAGGSGRTTVHYYLYFPTKRVASDASRILKTEGYDVQLRRGADGVNWLVLVSYSLNASTEDAANVGSWLENFARSLGGEYDGEEVAL